jgi:hypothetical protein
MAQVGPNEAFTDVDAAHSDIIAPGPAEASTCSTGSSKISYKVGRLRGPYFGHVTY